jgi:hypothetical protein
VSVLKAACIVVADRTFQAGYQKLALFGRAFVQVDGAERRGLLLPVAAMVFDLAAVVAKHVITRPIQHADNIFNVIERQITTAQDQVDLADAGTDARAIQDGLYFVANYQSTHKLKL